MQFEYFVYEKRTPKIKWIIVMKIKNIFINGMSKTDYLWTAEFFICLSLQKLRTKMSGNYIIEYIL